MIIGKTAVVLNQSPTDLLARGSTNTWVELNKHSKHNECLDCHYDGSPLPVRLGESGPIWTVAPRPFLRLLLGRSEHQPSTVRQGGQQPLEPDRYPTTTTPPAAATITWYKNKHIIYQTFTCIRWNHRHSRHACNENVRVVVPGTRADLARAWAGSGSFYWPPPI